MKVLVSDNLSMEGLQLLRDAEGIELNYQPNLSSEALVQQIGEYDALIIRSGTHITAEVLEAADQLRVIGRAGFGVENIDLEAANRKGVIVLNTPLGNATTTAEHSIGLLMSLARRIPQAQQAVRDGQWEKDAFVGVEVTGKTLGVVGAGKIGSLVIERAIGLKMRVMVHDPYLPSAAIHKLGAQEVTLADLLGESDFVCLHLPMTEETENLINAQSLALMKPTSYLINCAPGGLIDEEALADALRAGKIAGAALDGFVREPPSKDHPLLGMDQVIVTPHIRAASADAQANVAVQVARQILAYLENGIVTNSLNMPTVSAEMLPEIQPYLSLAERLGGFMAQYGPRALTGVDIDYFGTVTDLDTNAISRALLKGLLSPAVGPSVNYVNAPFVAKERDISVKEARTKATQGFANQIRVSVRNNESMASVSGTLFSEKHYRIVDVDGYPVEGVPKGHLVLLHNRDVPGVIGFIGQTLAEGQINIANMDLARQVRLGQVVCFISIDSALPESVLSTLRGHEDIFDVTPIHLP